MTLSWQDGHISKMTYKPSKLGQTDLFLVCDQRSSVDLCLHDYESLCLVVMICASLVNTQTDRHQRQLLPAILLAQHARRAKNLVVEK